MVYRAVRDFGLAEEISQEVFIKAYRALKSFRFDCKLSSWLVRIALNAVSTHRNSKRAQQDAATDLYSAQVGDLVVQNAEEELLAKERITFFYRCFKKLSDKFRGVVLLIAIQSASYEDAAEILQIPVGTVRSRLNQARLQLVRCISIHGIAQ